MRVTKTMYMPYLNKWLTTHNLWICDEAHRDTCQLMVTPVKPTERQIRRFKKEAGAWYRKDTRAAQKKEQRRLWEGLVDD